MSIYDKNQKRIRELRRKVELGKMDPAMATPRIAKLANRPPEYWVKGTAYGKAYDKKVPDNSSSIKAARDFDMRLKVQVQDRTFTPAELLKVRLQEIFTAHLAAQAGKGGEKSSKTRHDHACRIFGSIKLDTLHNNAEQILEKGFAHTPEKWKQKTKHLLWSFMNSAIGRYLKKNPKIQINNPMAAFPVPHGTEAREVFPTEQDYLERLAHVRNNPARIITREGKGPMRVGYPAYFYPLLVIKYQQGLRGMEIIPWRFEKADLSARRPAVQTKILKKGAAKAEQWVVLTPASFKALRDYLDTIPGPKEVGPVWPVKNWPTALMRRLLNECGQSHLNPHDDRRAWTMNHIDKNGERRRAAVGRETEDSETFYKHFNRQEQEAFYADVWNEYENQRDLFGDQNV
jgi:integrase